MDLKTAKSVVQGLITEMNDTDKAKFINWMKIEYWSEKDATTTEAAACGGVNGDVSPNKRRKACDSETLETADATLTAIRLDLRYELPPLCVLDSEDIHQPQDSSACGNDFDNVQHVDAFIYDDDDLDLAVSEGKLVRSYCAKCGSREVNDLELISHSMSVAQVKYLSEYVLRGYKDKKLLDIGSRTGALLYGVALYSTDSISHSTGVELNKEFADLNQTLVNKYNLDKRITIVNDDILNCAHLIQQADVVVMHNVFEFFTDKEQQTKLWRFCLDEIRGKPGRILIACPPVDESLAQLHMDYDDYKFLTVQDMQQHLTEYLASLDTDEMENVDTESLSGLCVYVVK